VQQLNPTLRARTQSLRETEMLPGQACLTRAGRCQKAVSTGAGEELNYGQILRSLMARNAEIDPQSLVARYSAAQRLQLSETALHRLDDDRTAQAGTTSLFANSPAREERSRTERGCQSPGTLRAHLHPHCQHCQNQCRAADWGRQ